MDLYQQLWRQLGKPGGKRQGAAVIAVRRSWIGWHNRARSRTVRPDDGVSGSLQVRTAALPYRFSTRCRPAGLRDQIPWERLGAGVRTGSASTRATLAILVDARIQLHHAVQVAGAAGRSFAAPRPDHRHGALFWGAGPRALVGADIPTTSGRINVGLSFEPPSLLVLGQGATPAAQLALESRSIHETVAWLRAQLGAAGLAGDQLVVRVPPDLPPHPVGAGAAFRVALDAAAQLGRWFGFANDLLADAAAGHGRQDDLPVPCWPYHFDFALVIPVKRMASGDQTITLGFSPGDSSIAEPYAYVLPWPAPRADVAGAPAPAGGHWQLEGWTGLALTASALHNAANPVAQSAKFFELGFELARNLLGR
jgi:hypothetical protein